MESPLKTINVVAALITDGKRVFATARGYGNYKGWWEFPGGKVEQGETPEDALVREIREELDAPYIVGVALIIYALINIFMELKFPESEISLGGAVVRGIMGIILLMETEQAIAILGIVWAVLSLNDVAEEIDDYRKTGKFRLVGAVSIVLTIVFSALLMLDPFEHFAFHIRILGLEMIAETFIHRKEEGSISKEDDHC